ncbi:MAG TPA: aromatic ring-hydroxylating dioxygenase subunit alpha [Mycobacteriales bacterium]|nr:aromatic ring-hydroxylating dioxygenase subunit alpha [Mycobacteriales bacterium]
MAVPFALERPDQAPKQRYYDPGFFRLEAEQLWPRTWQMAARLEAIPDPFDFITYEILDQSVVVTRAEDGSVRAFQNACRHRGVRIAQGSGRCESGFTCPFHGWCYDAEGKNTAVTRKGTFSEHNLVDGELDLTPVRCDTWGGFAWINLDGSAPPLRDYLGPAATILDAWHIESLQAEWWYACRLPVNWKLAEEAFQEQYHVLEAHPQLRIPGRLPPRGGRPFDPAAWLDAEIHYLHVMSDGMAGMVHANDVKVAEGLRSEFLAGELPEDPLEVMALWQRTLNDAVVAWHRDNEHDIPDLNAIEEQRIAEPMVYGFPHFFVLPMYSSASAYRFRPIGPEETLMEIWSLTRFPDGPREKLPEPEVWECDDPRWPPIPAQDFSNLPRQQQGLHARGFEFMRLSERAEGGVINFERMVDGFLAGLGYDKLLPALQHVNVNPLEQPVRDLGY